MESSLLLLLLLLFFWYNKSSKEILHLLTHVVPFEGNALLLAILSGALHMDYAFCNPNKVMNDFSYAQ